MSAESSSVVEASNVEKLMMVRRIRDDEINVILILLEKKGTMAIYPFVNMFSNLVDKYLKFLL